MNRFRQFMYGRYARLDRVNIAVIIAWLAIALIRNILGIIFRFTGLATPIGILGAYTGARIILSVLFGLEIACIVVFILRFFSKNIAKRTEENTKFTNWLGSCKDKNSFRNKRKEAHRDGKELFQCPVCKKTIRGPLGKGKIEITCPNCNEKFVRKK